MTKRRAAPARPVITTFSAIEAAFNQQALRVTAAVTRVNEECALLELLLGELRRARVADVRRTPGGQPAPAAP